MRDRGSPEPALVQLILAWIATLAASIPHLGVAADHSREVRIDFSVRSEAGLNLDATAIPSSARPWTGQRFQIYVAVESRSHEATQFLVAHRVEPPEAAPYLRLVDCSLTVAPVVRPGRREKFESNYFLSSALPDKIQSIRVVYEFIRLESTYYGLSIRQVQALTETQRAQLRDGSRLYIERCSACHGREGKGDGPVGSSLDPAPKDLRLFLAGRDDQELHWVIRQGKGVMPAFGRVLTEDEIRDLAFYLRTIFGTRRPKTAGRSSQRLK